jgi:hypothetical protein
MRSITEDSVIQDQVDARPRDQDGEPLPAIQGARTLVALYQPPPLEQAPDPRHDRREHLGHVEVRQEWGRPSPLRRPAACARKVSK